jgi:hypothetical protein
LRALLVRYRGAAETRGGRVSGDIVRLNPDGVLLRYGDPSQRHALHDERKAQPDDLQRVAILKAERALTLIRIITEHAEFSDYALSRLEDALEEIYEALQLKRRECGMCTEAGA